MTQISEYNKVSFITSKSTKIPKLLRETGALIVLSELTKEKRISLWLRNNVIASGWGLSTRELMENCEWMSNSYNPIFSPTNEGMSYFIPSENTEDTKDFVYNTNGEIIGKPQSIHMLLSYGLDFTYKYGNDLKERINTIEGQNKYFDQKITYIENTLIPETKTYCCTYAYEIGSKVKEEAYTYTKYWADRIIGGSPDFLDSLEEIKEFLRLNKENDMNVFKRVNELEKYTIKRKEEENGFSYINDTVTYKYYDIENTGTYEYVGYNPDGSTYIGQGTYTTTIERIYNGGQIAINSNTINSGIGNIQLDKLLKALLQPYPYKKPELIEYKINKLNSEEYSEDLLEYGSDNFGITNFEVKINKNSANGISNFKLVNENKETSPFKLLSSNNLTNITNILNTNNVLSKVPIGNSSLDDICKYYTLFNGYKFEYDKSDPQVYPQLEELGITDINEKLDTKHAFEAGIISNKFDNPIRKKFSYKVFWGIGNIIPTTDQELTSQNNKYLTSKDTTGRLYIYQNNGNKIWIGLPFNFSIVNAYNPKIFMKSWISGIENDITDINTNMMSFTNINQTIKHNGINYYIYSLENKGYTTFAEKVSLEIFFNI